MIKWILESLNTTLQGIKKGWNWLISKIKNIFSSKKNNNTELEEVKTEEQNQQQSRQKEVVINQEQTPDQSQSVTCPVKIDDLQKKPEENHDTKPEEVETKQSQQEKIVIITPEQSPQSTVHRRNNPDPVKTCAAEKSNVTTSLFNQLSENLKFHIKYLDDGVKSLIMKDESILRLIEKYPGAAVIFFDKTWKQLGKNLPSYLLSVQKLIEGSEELIGVLNSKKILNGSYQSYYTTDDVIMHCGSTFHNNSGFIDLLKHLARRDETMLNRIKNHPELAKCVLLAKKGPADGKLCTEIFDILFSKDQEDILEKLEYDLVFTTGTLKEAHYSEDVEDFIHKMSCLKNKEDVRLLKRVCNSCYSGRCYDSSQQYNPRQQLIRKLFEHHYSDPFTYKTASSLENIDLHVQIDITANKNRDEGIVYDETSKQYKVHLKNSYNNNDDIDTIIEKVLDKHFDRIKGIVKERLPNCDKIKLEDYLCVENKNEAIADPLHNMRSLQHICLETLDKSLDRS